jgi:lipid A 4'-phosphatase
VDVSVARVVFLILAILAISTGFVFAVDPALDLQVASFFRDVVAQPEMRGFPRFNEFVRDLGSLIIIAAIVPAVVAIGMKLFWPKQPAPLSSRSALFLILTLSLGPGLLVNGLLKEHWARPRPGMVTEFGGDNAFRPWWDPRGTCVSNCSFVSGETSSAVWLAAPVLLVPPPWRYVALAAVGLYGVGVAFIRMMAGGHFLSDVIFAGIFTGVVIWLVHGALYRWSATRLQDQAIDSVLERVGRSMMRPFSTFLPSRAARPDKSTPPV